MLSTNEELFGTWEFLGPRPEQFSGHDIIVNEWLAEDLKVNIGDPIRLGYHVVGSHGELPEIETTSRLSCQIIVALDMDGMEIAVPQSQR